MYLVEERDKFSRKRKREIKEVIRAPTSASTLK